MKDTLILIVAFLAGGATFGLLLRKFGGDCIP